MSISLCCLRMWGRHAGRLAGAALFAARVAIGVRLICLPAWCGLPHPCMPASRIGGWLIGVHAATTDIDAAKETFE